MCLFVQPNKAFNLNATGVEASTTAILRHRPPEDSGATAGSGAAEHSNPRGAVSEAPAPRRPDLSPEQEEVLSERLAHMKPTAPQSAKAHTIIATIQL